MAQESTFASLLALAISNPVLEDPAVPKTSEDYQMHSRAVDVLVSPHPGISHYFFPQIGPDIVDRTLVQDRLAPVAHFFRDAGNLEPEDVQGLCRVITALRDRNHPELLAAFLALRVDDFVLSQLHNSAVVRDILEGVFLNLTFRNYQSARHISSPAEPANPNPTPDPALKIKVFDFVEEAVMTGKSSDKQTDEHNKPNAHTFLSRSQRSVSRLSSKGGTVSKNVSMTPDLEHRSPQKADPRVAMLFKLADDLVVTADDRITRNLVDLFSSLLMESKTGSNLRVLLDEVLYDPRFQERLTTLIFKSKPGYKFVQGAGLLIRLITHHEDYFFFRNGPESVMRLTPPFYRFLNDCIEPLNEILGKVG